MRRIYSSVLCLVRTAAFAAVLGGLAARAETVEDFNTWIHYSITTRLPLSPAVREQWRFTFDSPNRFGNDSGKYSQGVWRAGLGYIINSQWSVWAGYGYTHTDVPYARTPFGEHRTFQQLLWSGRSGRFSLASRHRLEERFPDTGDDMGLRSRHQFRVSHPILGLAWLSWVVSEEVFLNLNATDYGATRGVDQNRFFAGLGWKACEVLRGEVGYMHQLNRRPTAVDRVNHVLAFNLALSFK